MVISRLYRDVLICAFAWLGGVGFQSENWILWAVALVVTVFLVFRTRSC